MRNNINGDFSIVEKISELKPGAFININWNKKNIHRLLTTKRGILQTAKK